jgi:hypothetical protein
LGARWATVPRTSTTVVVHGTTYYYAGGVYYVRSGTSYVVVSAPPGAVVHAVPTYTTVVYVDQTPYYYYGGTYYVVTDEAASTTTVGESGNTAVKESYPSYAQEGESKDETVQEGDEPELPPMIEDDQNYKVVAPPVGATVPYLPEEADEETVGGKKYMVYGGTYYRPFSSDGDTVYMVVEDPRE